MLFNWTSLGRSDEAPTLILSSIQFKVKQKVLQLFQGLLVKDRNLQGNSTLARIK